MVDSVLCTLKYILGMKGGRSEDAALSTVLSK